MVIARTPSYYSEEQLRCYLKKIRLPAFDDASRLPEANLATLRAVMLRHILAFPYENVEMHYSKDHIVRVAPQDAYRRMVLESQGGWCCGQNGLMLGIIRALGYPAYGGGGRVNNRIIVSDIPIYSPLGHMVIFVEIDSTVYLVDVGFGGGGPTQPILLKDGEISQGACGEDIRLEKSRPAHSVRPTDESWVLTSRRGPDGEWRVLYQFSETELFENDFIQLSLAQSMRTDRGFLFDNVVCFVHELAGETEPDDDMPELGRLRLDNTKVIRERKGQKEILEEFKKEEDRVRALAQHFGIIISPEDVLNIRGRQPTMPFLSGEVHR